MPMIKLRAMCYSRNTGCSFSNPGSSANCFAGVVLNGISAVSREASVGSYFETAEASFLETSHVATMQSCFALLMTRLLFLSFRPFLAFMTTWSRGLPRWQQTQQASDLHWCCRQSSASLTSSQLVPVPVFLPCCGYIQHKQELARFRHPYA